jgi:hypothetical protein
MMIEITCRANNTTERYQVYVKPSCHGSPWAAMKMHEAFRRKAKSRLRSGQEAGGGIRSVPLSGVDQNSDYRLFKFCRSADLNLFAASQALRSGGLRITYGSPGSR